MTRESPNDLVAEANVIGACLLSSAALEQAVDLVEASDFYGANHGGYWDAVVHLWQRGEAVNATTVADYLKSTQQPFDAKALVECQSAVPSTSGIRTFCRIVVEHAARRKLLDITERAQSAIYNLADPSELIDAITSEAAKVDLPSARLPEDLWTLDEFRGQAEEAAPWVVPGLLRKGWRAVIVATEGAGKSLLTEQVAMCAAAGVHPLNFSHCPPVTALLVDLENDAHRVVSGTELVDRGLSLKRKSDAGVWLWHRPGGINLRQRRDRSTFETVLAHVRPQLVCLGPVYKCYESKASESDERVAAEVQAVFDDLRTRYGFALLLEHHAPHGESNRSRDMRPYGSSLWLRWPEFGLALRKHPDIKGSLEVGRWRGDRVKGEWPDRLDRSSSMPWVGYWERGLEVVA